MGEALKKKRLIYMSRFFALEIRLPPAGGLLFMLNEAEVLTNMDKKCYSLCRFIAVAILHRIENKK